jgi:hypothetical protein
LLAARTLQRSHQLLQQRQQQRLIPFPQAVEAVVRQHKRKLVLLLLGLLLPAVLRHHLVFLTVLLLQQCKQRLPLLPQQKRPLLPAATLLPCHLQ